MLVARQRANKPLRANQAPEDYLARPSFEEGMIGGFVYTKGDLFMRDDFLHTDGFIFGLTDLNPAEILIYSTICNFSKKGGKGYTGTLEYLKDTIHQGKQAVIHVLNSLMEKGYLIKTKTKGVRSPCYKAVLPKKRAVETGEEISDEEIRREIESLNESMSGIPSSEPTKVCATQSQMMSDTITKVCDTQFEGMSDTPKQDSNKIGEKDIDNKKETPKKKEGEETGKKQGGKYLPGHDPLVAELYYAKYAIYEELSAYDGKIAYIIENRSREVAESVVHEFLASLADGDWDKGPAHFDGFVFKKIGL